MARHAAPRSPRLRRLLIGGAGLSGVAATVALGVLAAPRVPPPTPILVPLADPSVAEDPVRSWLTEPRDQQAQKAAQRSRDAYTTSEVESAATEKQAADEVARVQAEQAKAAKAQAEEDARLAEQAAENAQSTTTIAPAPRPAPAATEEPSTDVLPGGSYQDYAFQLLGEDKTEMAALENLWGRESGWDPDAQNPGSTAYGIPQFLDSTWAATGIAKTDDPYLQIQAGLIYIEDRYGSPSRAWAHSQATGWY